MALKPCKVCGTLNAEGVDTCLSCGHDPEASKRPAIFRYAAIAVAFAMAMPIVLGLFNWVLWQLKPKTPEPNPSRVSLFSSHSLRD